MHAKLAIVDFGTGNIRSVVRAFRHLGVTPSIATKPSAAYSADAIVFPGQGCFPDCMDALRKTGFDVFLKDWISADKPFFGICLGLQVLFEWSEEGEVSGLGLFSGKVSRFRLPQEYKIPHMGWNEVQFARDNASWLRAGISDTDQFYFVHSYFVEPQEESLVFCHTDYGEDFVSGISVGNCHATQFHPEKSQAKGLQIYRNFLEGIACS